MIRRDVSDLVWKYGGTIANSPRPAPATLLSHFQGVFRGRRRGSCWMEVSEDLVCLDDVGPLEKREFTGTLSLFISHVKSRLLVFDNSAVVKSVVS